MTLIKKGEGSLLEHLEALRLTVWRCILAVGIILVPALYFSSEILAWMIRFICPPGLKLHYFSPFEPLFIQLNLGLAVAVMLASPVILWQFAAFIAPGLYECEKKAVGGLCSFALLLALCGAALGFFFVIPQVMIFSMTFATEELQPVIGLGNFLKLVVWMLIGFALVFELPVFLLIPIRAGLLSVGTLKKCRCLFVSGIFLVAALLTPPDVISQLALGIPGWLLFELTLLIASRVQKKNDDDSGDDDDREESFDPAEGSSEPEKPEVSKVNERSRLAGRSGRIRKL